MGKQLVIYRAYGFNADDFSHEIFPMKKDYYFDCYRFYKDEGLTMYVEFSIKKDIETDWGNAEFFKRIKEHCNSHMDSIIGIAYRQACTSGPVDYFLSYIVNGQERIVFRRVEGSLIIDGRFGTKEVHGIDDLSKVQKELYADISNILKSNNQAFKYLLLYEKLNQMCGGRQIDVDDFVKTSHTAFVRSIQKSIPCSNRTSDPNRQGQNETEVTYLRNVFGHPDEKCAYALDAYSNARLDVMIKNVIELIYEKAQL